MAALKVFIHGHTKKHLVPKLLLKISDKEPQNIMVSPPKKGSIKEAICQNKSSLVIIPDATHFHPN